MTLKEQLAEILSLFIQNKEKLNDNENISIGNEGVFASKQASKQADKQASTKHIKENYDSFSSVEKLFNSLTKREFLTFLTIYQLEDDLKRVTYQALSNHLKLTENCVRMYVVSIIKKRLPLLKEKVNNKITLLYIDPQFRELGIKTKLMSLYNHIDSSQTTLDKL